MNKIERISAILIKLQSRKIVTAQHIAEQFGISLRTVYRDLQILEQAGVPIVSNMGVGYSLAEGHKLPPLMFTMEEGIGFRNCKVRPCCMEHHCVTCADCKEHVTTKNCKKYNPLSIKLGEYISSTSRRRAIEKIKEKGLEEFAAYMKANHWVTIKTKNTLINKNI